MNKKVKYIFLGLSILGTCVGAYFLYEWYMLKNAYEKSGTVSDVNNAVQDSAAKLGVSASDDYEADDAVTKSDTSIDGSQIAVINSEIFFLNTDDGTYVSSNGDIYDPSTQSLTTAGDNGSSTHIDSSQVQLTTN